MKRQRKIPQQQRHFSSKIMLIDTILLITILFLIHPSQVMSFEVQESSSSSSQLVKGSDMLSEIEQLHLSLSRISSLLATSNVSDDSEIMKKTAKLVRRVRALVYANSENNILSDKQRRERERLLRQKERQDMRKEERTLRGRSGSISGIGSGEFLDQQAVQGEEKVEEEERALEEMPWMEDDVTRRLYDQSIDFPECQHKYLETCLEILNSQMVELVEFAQLQKTPDYVIHEKRNPSQEGYNKVVIVTDLTASFVKGRMNDGIVTYPFFWDDGVQQRMLGVEGKWDCHLQTPEECCAFVQEGVPPDVHGNYLQCHIFVPYGGVGNKKRDDRILINLSPDGRVHESPKVA